MTPSLRGIAASFDAIAMTALAVVLTEGSFSDPVANAVLWGSAAAAVVAALVVLLDGPVLLGWAAVGYIVFAGLLASDRVVPVVLLLALAYVPILERPRRSLALGVSAALLCAVALGVARSL
ncbi:MAG: hypothetical protein HYX56_04285 [Chloroflexi bacterium]|nr:hypothetical protein [Chloroflexota bacterium]